MKSVIILIFIPIISFAKVKIAIIDSGISKTNIENINYNEGFNFDLNSKDFPAMEETNNHGTFLAGVLAGHPQVDKDVEVIPVQFANLNSKNPNSKREAYYKSFEYAIAKRVDIISLSIVSHMADKKEKALIQKAISKGIRVFVASGNEEKSLEASPTYPCSYNIKKVICVGNIDDTKKITSNWGKEVDIYVKGARIASGNSGELVFKDGSSVSTAIVAHQYAKFKINKEKNFLNYLKKNNVLYKRMP